jgi:hypothetical protein
MLQRPSSFLPRGEMADNEPSPPAVILKRMMPLTTAWKRPGNKFLISPLDSFWPAKLGAPECIRRKLAQTSALSKIIIPLYAFRRYSRDCFEENPPTGLFSVAPKTEKLCALCGSRKLTDYPASI